MEIKQTIISRITRRTNSFQLMVMLNSVLFCLSLIIHIIKNETNVDIAAACNPMNCIKTKFKTILIKFKKIINIDYKFNFVNK